MSDLVAKLREPNGILDWQYRHICADRIERLEAALQEMIDIAYRQDVYSTDEPIIGNAILVLEGKE